MSGGKKHRNTLTMRNRWDKYLSKIYFDPKHPASFKGPSKVFQSVQNEGVSDIPLAYIKKWLKNQDSYTLNKPLRRKFKRSRVIVTGLKDQYEADLADMQKIAKENDGVRFLLVVIDVFSRYLWVEPLQSKHEGNVINAFRNLMQKSGTPRRMRTDRGKEFTGRKVQTYFKNEHMEHWTAHNDEMKANFAERVIRTLKTSLWGYMRKNNTRRYIDHLQDMVSAYNNTQHRSIGMKPSEVKKGDVESAVWWEQYRPKYSYEKSKKLLSVKFMFKKGDHVRISHMAKTFERGHDEKWTSEIFTIRSRYRSRAIRKYKLDDLLGENIDGSFYEAELQGVTYDNKKIFNIEKILKSRGKGLKKEILVKWEGWPEKFNSWILATDLEGK